MGNEHIVICGVDPGTLFTGVAFLLINCETNKIDYLYTYLVKLDEKQSTSDRLISLHNKIRKLSYEFNINIVGVENSFFNRFRPSAVIPLAQAVMSIRLAFNYRCRQVPILMLAPKEIKKEFIKHSASKVDMRIAMLAYPFPEEILLGINNISEHEVDAVAIAVVIYERFLNGAIQFL